MREPVREKFRSLTRASVVKAIGGREFRFFAFRPPMVAELLGLGSKLAGSIAAFTEKGAADRGFKNKTIETTDGKQTDIEHVPATLDVLKYRTEERVGAIKAVSEVLAGDLFARMVADSLRDEFDENGAKLEDVKEFWSCLDFGLAAEFVTAAMEANAKVIRPLVERVGLNLRAEVKSVLQEAGARAGIRLVPKEEEQETETSSTKSNDVASGSPVT